MASAKKKQDESNLKVLRELVSQTGNKECFDCQQRGPTYVDMTIGSFVCTTCSGILRGLTPPHRVKSISMATFTQEEIDFLKKRGNEYCKAIWLGLLPPNEKLQNNTKDEQKIKDFMSAKYELKRYYLEPTAANQISNQKQQSQNLKSEVSSSNNKVQIKNKNINETPKNNAAKVLNSNNIDFIADFSKVPEPSPLIIPPIKQPTVPQPSFANFDNNPIFNSTSLFTSMNQNNPSNLTNSNVKINSPPPEDRYAALKDLDSMMKQMQLKDETKNMWSNKETNNFANTSWSAFDQSNSSLISNPFTTSVVSPTASIINNNFNGNSTLMNTNSHSYNPFRQINNSTINKDFYWFGNESQNVENVQNNVFSPFFNNSCQPSSPGFKANPFMVDSTTRNVSHNSNNPFL